MTHLIDSSAVERLARLSGVLDFDEWKRQLVDQGNRINQRLDGTVAVAWTKCLPTWLELGRVRDLSLAIRVPKYSPSFANTLGMAFAEEFRDDAAFMIEILETCPADSHEYLCAVDLLEFIACDVEPLPRGIAKTLFEIGQPLPRVVQLEIANDNRYDGITTVGEYLKRRHDIENQSFAEQPKEGELE